MAEKKKKTTAKKTTKKKKPSKKAEVKKAEEVVEVAEVTKVSEVAEVKTPEVKPAVAVAPKPKKEKVPKGHKYYGTGRRKEATAKVWLKPGSGKVSINGKGLIEYFSGRKLLEFQVMRSFVVTNTAGNYDVFVEAFGGGIPGQAGAISLGIARALLEISPDFRVKLKREGLLRRDPRMKERKKYGLKRARRAFQYTKR